MPPVDMTPRNADFLISEANGFRSRAEVTVNATTAALEPGTVLGMITSSGNYIRHDSGLSNGAQNVAGILMIAIGAEGANRTVIVRDAEVAGADLIYEDGANASQITAANAALAALGIVVR
ncbi:MAG: head decoration protein [Pseudomonadota bacterium]